MMTNYEPDNTRSFTERPNRNPTDTIMRDIPGMCRQIARFKSRFSTENTTGNQISQSHLSIEPQTALNQSTESCHAQCIAFSISRHCGTYAGTASGACPPPLGAFPPRFLLPFGRPRGRFAPGPLAPSTSISSAARFGFWSAPRRRSCKYLMMARVAGHNPIVSLIACSGAHSRRVL